MTTAEWRDLYEKNGAVDLWVQEEFNSGSRIVVSSVAAKRAARCAAGGRDHLGQAGLTPRRDVLHGAGRQRCLPRRRRGRGLRGRPRRLRRAGIQSENHQPLCQRGGGGGGARRSVGTRCCGLRRWCTCCPTAPPRPMHPRKHCHQRTPQICIVGGRGPGLRAAICVPAGLLHVLHGQGEGGRDVPATQPRAEQEPARPGEGVGWRPRVPCLPVLQRRHRSTPSLACTMHASALACASLAHAAALQGFALMCVGYPLRCVCGRLSCGAACPPLSLLSEALQRTLPCDGARSPPACRALQ